MNTDNSQGKEGVVRQNNGFLIYEMLIIIAMTTLLIMIFFDNQVRLVKEQHDTIQSLNQLQSLLHSQEEYAAGIEPSTAKAEPFSLTSPVIIEESVPISTVFISRMHGFLLTEPSDSRAAGKNTLPWIDVNLQELTHESFA